MLERMPEPEARERRVVLLHPNGLHQILGTLAGEPAHYFPIEAGIEVGGKPAAIGLIAITPRMFVYAPLGEGDLAQFESEEDDAI